MAEKNLTINWIERYVKVNPNHRKESKYTGQYSVLAVHKENGESMEIVNLKFYRTDSRCYACVWVRRPDNIRMLSSSAYASGYGYHKGSQAAQSAIEQLLIEDEHGLISSANIGGAGDDATKKYIMKVAEEAFRSTNVAKSEYHLVIHNAHS